MKNFMYYIIIYYGLFYIAISSYIIIMYDKGFKEELDKYETEQEILPLDKTIYTLVFDILTTPIVIPLATLAMLILKPLSKLLKTFK